MTGRVLIEGCSFVEMFSLYNEVNLQNKFNWDRVWGRINTDRYDIRGGAGSGNHVIAMRVLHHIAREKYDKVIVIWSGINRLDAVIPRQMFDALGCDFEYVSHLDDLSYLHCGGYLGVGHPKMPKVIDEYFRLQIKASTQRYYPDATSRYLTDLTLHNVTALQGILQAQNIEYQMGWMYDIHADYQQTAWEPGCGRIDTTSPLMALVDWSKISDQSALEWCLQKDMMYPDGFHWSWEGGHQWLLDVMGEDIYRG